MKQSTRLVLALIFAGALRGQTQQGSTTAATGSRFNLGTATSVAPMPVGTSLPGTCTIGDQFYKSNATAGQNLYACTSTNTWTQQAGGGGSGASAIYQLTDFGATKTSATILTLGTGCASTTPCLIRIGSVVYRLTSAPTVTISGTSNNGSAYVYLSSAQVLTVGHNTTTTLTCSAGCTVATSIAGIPTDATPLWIVTWTANVWDTIAESMDNRALISRNVFACGTGLTCSTDPTTGIQTGSVTSSGGTYWQNFQVGAIVNGTLYAMVDSNSGTLIAVTAATGPDSLTGNPITVLLAANQFVKLDVQAPGSWSGAAGTLDVTWTVINRDGASGGGQWNFNVYTGCATQDGTYTYGAASTTAVTPSSTAGLFSHYGVTGVTLGGTCAAGLPLQIWIERKADTGGTTGLNVAMVSAQVAIRGN